MTVTDMNKLKGTKMKTLILILTMLFISITAIAQELDKKAKVEKSYYYTYSGTFHGNLFDNNLLGLRSVDNFGLTVLGGKYTLTHTGAEIDVIHGGTFAELEFAEGSFIYMNGSAHTTFMRGTGNQLHLKGLTQVSLWAAGVEILNVDANSIDIHKSIQPETDGNISIGIATKRIAAIYAEFLALSQGLNYRPDTSSTDAYKLDMVWITDEGTPDYTTGLKVTFIATTANTDGATLEINALSAIAITVARGGAINTALTTNNILAGQIVEVVFDGTQWQMVSRVAD